MDNYKMDNDEYLRQKAAFAALRIFGTLGMACCLALTAYSVRFLTSAPSVALRNMVLGVIAFVFSHDLFILSRNISRNRFIDYAMDYASEKFAKELEAAADAIKQGKPVHVASPKAPQSLCVDTFFPFICNAAIRRLPKEWIEESEF